MSKTESNHRWSFYRAGGVDQVRLDKGADIFNLDQLDQKLWVALSCPTKGLEIDDRMLLTNRIAPLRIGPRLENCLPW